MFFIKWKNLLNYDFFSILIILLGFFYSLNFYTYVYDPHHHGLIFSNAIDLLNGKIPYKEIFIQYGLLTTFFHTIVIKLFGQELYYINAATIFLYYLTLFFLNISVKELTNKFFGFLSSVVIICNHPIIWLPWSNYVAYFFLILAITFFIKKNYSDSYLFGFILFFSVLSRQEIFIPIFFSLLTLFLLSIIFKKKIYYKSITSFLLPIIFFISILFFLGIFNEWSKTLYLPSLYLEYRETNLLSLILNFLSFFTFKPLLNFINEPQYVIILFILYSSSFILVKSFFSQKLNLIFLSVLTLSLSILSLNLELFRLYTSVSFGIILLLKLVYNVKNLEIRSLYIFLICFFSFYSIIFYPLGNNELFKKINKSNYNNTELPYLKYIKLSKNYNHAYNELILLKNKIYSNCKIIFSENLTFDTMNSIFLEKNRNKLTPFVKAQGKNDKLHFFFDDQFIFKINSNLTLNNTIILTEFENLKYDIGVISFPNNYLFKSIIFNYSKEKPKLIYVYYPKECIL